MALEAKRESQEAALAAAAAAEVEAERDESEAEDMQDGSDDGPKKTRFVWTRELHGRFEQAVHQLGVGQAKPQAIRQLMGCETEEDLPTRQNIKSHLQKYRLLLQKKAQQQGGGGTTAAASPAAASRNSAAPAPSAANASAAVTNGRERKASPTSSTGNNAHVAHNILQRQYQGVLAQLDMHAKLHEQLMAQRSTQAALGLKLSEVGTAPAMSHSQLRRMAEHVIVQRNLLQHLCRLLHAQSIDGARFATKASSLFAEQRRSVESLEMPDLGVGELGMEVASESDKTGASNDFFGGSLAGSDLFDEHLGDGNLGDDHLGEEVSLSALLVPGSPPSGSDNDVVKMMPAVVEVASAPHADELSLTPNPHWYPHSPSSRLLAQVNATPATYDIFTTGEHTGAAPIAEVL